MENIISKELLGAVMGYKISNNHDEQGITRIIGLEEGADGSLDLDFGYQYLEKSGGRYINVYQLAHKCKEWAFKEGYNLWCYPKKIEISKNGIKVDTVHNVNFDNPTPFDPFMDIEACQVVLSRVYQKYTPINKDNLESYINKTIYHGTNKDECTVTRIIRKDELMVKMVSDEFASSHSNVFIKDCWVKE